MTVDPTDLSVKVGAHYLGRSHHQIETATEAKRRRDRRRDTQTGQERNMPTGNPHGGRPTDPTGSSASAAPGL